MDGPRDCSGSHTELGAKLGFKPKSACPHRQFSFHLLASAMGHNQLGRKSNTHRQLAPELEMLCWNPRTRSFSGCSPMDHLSCPWVPGSLCEFPHAACSPGAPPPSASSSQSLACPCKRERDRLQARMCCVAFTCFKLGICVCVLGCERDPWKKDEVNRLNQQSFSLLKGAWIFRDFYFLYIFQM